MKRAISASILITFVFFQCYSQSDLRNGYVILNNNDTIFGLINNGSKKENSLKCVFARDPKSEKITYYPGDIRVYRFTDSKYYISRAINPSDTEKVFLEFMFDGIIDLYYYYDMGDHYLAEKNNSGLKELKNETITKRINDKQYVQESKEYIGILKVLYKESPAIANKVESLSLDHNSLIQITEDYHNAVCPDEGCITYSKRKINAELSFGPLTGITFSHLSVEEYNIIFDRFHFPPSSTGIAFGGFLNIRDPFISQKISVQLEAAITRTKYSTDISYLNLTTLKIPILLKYTFPFKKLQPSLMAGLGYNYILNFNNYNPDYGNFELLKVRDLYSLTGGIEAAWMFNSKTSAFIQFRYEHSIGYHHIGIWDDRPNWENMFSTYFNNIYLVTGFKF
ncbi:MAG: PorT family protein [Bacteroidales bacterium]|nr:PorT family protein [Bacteroidales bacterium]